MALPIALFFVVYHLNPDYIMPRVLDYRAAPVFAATRWIAPAGWGLVLKVDREEALALYDLTTVDEAIDGLAPGMAKYAWSATHTTFSPNVVGRTAMRRSTGWPS